MKTITSIAALAAFVVSSIVSAAPVNINTASAAEIAEALNGIGLSKAQAIVDYRNEYGNFESTEELLNVTGIGKHILDVNRANIVLSEGD